MVKPISGWDRMGWKSLNTTNNYTKITYCANKITCGADKITFSAITVFFPFKSSKYFRNDMLSFLSIKISQKSCGNPSLRLTQIRKYVNSGNAFKPTLVKPMLKHKTRKMT